MRVGIRGRLLTTTILLGASLSSAPLMAQAVPAETAAADAAEATIVVTGSRIARPDLEQASPIQVVSSEEFRLQAGGSNVENVLNDLPQVVGSTSSADNNPGGGIATVDLRQLGTQRTLVLVDGRRYISYDTSQVVDLNTIPSALIDRVDVVTGGRSAVYGSDAIAGVVNFVMKRDFQGIELNSQYGLSERGDAQYWDLNGTMGANFDDGRGNVTMHVGYLKRRGTFAGSRGFSRNAITDAGDGTTFFGGSGSVPQGRVNVGGLGALTGTFDADGEPVDNFDFGPDGSITPYAADGDSYNFAPVNYLQVPQERFLISTRGHYEINDAVQPYFEGTFINNRVTGELAPTPISSSTPIGTGAAQRALGPLRLQVASPFFSPATRATFAAIDATDDTPGDGYVTTANYGFRTLGIGPRRQIDERNAFRILGGVRGDIGSGWNYDGYYLYARTKNTQRQTGNVNLANFLGSITTAFDANGNLVCANGDPGCVPANLFGLGNLSAASASYLAIGATNIEEYTTQVAQLAITNSNLFDFGAGGVGVAFGVERRSESGRTDPDQNLASGNVAGFNPGAATGGSYSVTEVFGEVNVPLLADAPFAHRLELNAAARYSNYSNAPGNVFTWAAGGLWQPVEGVGVRGQYQKAIRGPSVNELFLGQTVSFDGANDPCGTAAAVATGTLRTQCLATGVPAARLGDPNLNDSDLVNPPTVVAGNPNLREESAKTWTVGAVLTPFRGFSFTVDYYNIKIDNYISRLGQATLFQACYDQGIQVYCDAFSRNTNGDVDLITDTSLNSGGLKTTGVDAAIGYNMPLGFGLFGNDESRLSLSVAGTRLIKYDFTPLVGVPITFECAGKFGLLCGSPFQPTPKWKHTARATLVSGPGTVSVAWRYIGKTRDDDPDTDYAAEALGSRSYIDLAFGMEPTDNLRLTAGVNNLFDKEPPLIASAQNGGSGEQSNTFPNVYDVLGRSFFVGATLRF